MRQTGIYRESQLTLEQKPTAVARIYRDTLNYNWQITRGSGFLARELKTFRRLVLEGPIHFPKFCLQEPYCVPLRKWAKNCLLLLKGREKKVNILKYAQSVLFLVKPDSGRNCLTKYNWLGFYQNITNLGEGNYTTLAACSFRHGERKILNSG